MSATSLHALFSAAALALALIPNLRATDTASRNSRENPLGYPSADWEAPGTPWGHSNFPSFSKPFLSREGFDGFCFDEATSFSDGVALVRRGTSHHVLLPDGSLSSPFPCQPQGAFSQSLIPCRDQGLWGFAATDGSWFRSPRWLAAGAFREGWAPVQDDSGLALLSLEGGVLRLSRVTRLREVHEGKAAAAQLLEDGEFWGFVDTLGHWVVPPQFLAVADGFSEGFAWAYGSAAGGNLAAFLDGQGAWMAGSDHAWLSDFRQGFAAFGDGRFVGKRFQGRFGVLDRRGNLRVSPVFEAIGAYRNGLAPAWRDGRSHLIDTAGATRFAAEAGVSVSEGPENGYVPVNTAAGWEFRSLGGNRPPLGPFAGAEGFREGWAKVRASEGCWGFIDTTGSPLTPLQGGVRRDLE